jgi:hypothetical protein
MREGVAPKTLLLRPAGFRLAAVMPWSMTIR